MRSALLITALVASALAGPTGVRDSCSRHCTDDNIFSYQQGRSYEYEYTAVTSTGLLDDLENKAEVKITAHAHVDVLAPCEYTLRLTQVTLQGSSHSEEMAAALTRSSLRFSFQDGVVEELCPSEIEETWVLNFKRGVLSAFQTSRTSPGKHEVHETDVLGMCLTRYENELEGDMITVSKEKDATSCTRRADIASYLSSAYTTDSPVQSLPLLDTTSACRQTVEGGILIDTHCQETYSFTPFSGQRGGAFTNVESRLKLVSRDGPAITPTEQSLVRKTPVFETATEATEQGQVEAVTTLLNQLEEASREEVRPQAPALFSRLVIVLRGLDYPVLSRVYAATTETHSRKFLVDAMPLVGTAAAAALVRDMFSNGDLSQEEVDAWFASLAYLKNPTSDIFTAIAPMLDNNPSQSALLGTSSLVNTFCKSHGACGDDSGVQQVMRRVEAQLGSGCRAVNEEQKVNILVALRALGNAGRWVNARPVLQRCYTEDNDVEVRVAAIEAWRHTPCEYDRSNLLSAYLDESQDTEVRIAAYLSVMTCPTPAVLAAVRDRLTSEGVNQVGSFVWTHLTNLQESAAPGKEWARLLLGEELLANKFSTEALRFSRNYESSFFMNEPNLGAAVESNVIFSSKSYLPRSGMLNLTLDLFGESVNLFEVGGRIEGFEAYLERLFGPDGYFPEDTVAAALRGMRHRKTDAEATTLEQFLEDATDEPRGSYYLRLFGNDVHYRRFHGLGYSGGQDQPSPFALLMELARGGNVDYTKSYQLMDTHLSVPTVAGLPLTLGAKGSATLGLRMDGSFRAQSLSDVRIEGHLRPSAAVTVNGVMLVDAHVTRAGVKVSSTLHTSTSLEGKVTINGGVVVDVAFNTPKQLMEIIDYDTKFFLVQDNKEEERPQYLPLRGGCSTGFIGMQVCSEVSYRPAALLPSTLRVYLEKTDTQTGYTFRFTKSPSEISVVFNNPEAKKSRRMALTLQAENNKVLVDVDSFLGKAEARGEYLWSRNKKSIQLDTVAGNSKFNLDAGLITSFSGETKVEPYVQVNVGQREFVNAKAELLANPQQNKYSADLFFSYMNNPLALKVLYDGAATTKTFGITVNSPAMDAVLDAKLDLNAYSLTVTSNADFKMSVREKRQFSSTFALGLKREGDATVYSSRLDMTLPYDEQPILVTYNMRISPTELNTDLLYNKGEVELVVSEKWQHTYENGVRRIMGHIVSKCDYIGLENTGDAEIILAENTLYVKSEAKARRGGIPSTHLVLLDLKRTPETSLKGLLKLESDVSFSASAELMKVNPGHYTAEVDSNASTPSSGNISLLSARAELKDNSGPRKFDINAEGSLSVGGNEMTLTSVVYGDPQQAKVDLQTKFNDKQYGMKLEGTRSSVFIDANVLKHVVVNANIDHEGPEKILAIGVEWDKQTNPDNEFKIEGKIEPDTITATFKFLEKEFSAVGRQVPQGVEVEATWSPRQRVGAAFRYTLGAAPSLSATLETTVPGWEKQSADVSASLQGNEVTCRASATWANSQQAALSVTGRQAGGAVQGEVTFSSTITGMERFSLTFDHKMAGATITSSLQGAWNDRQLNGSFQLTPTDTGLNGRALFTSPLTQAFEAVLSHQLQGGSLDSSLWATYGSTQLIKVTSTGRLSLAQHHDVDLTLKLTTELDSAVNAEASVQYSLDGKALRLVVDAKAGQRKMMLTVNGEKTVTEESTAISGDLRFLTPFTQPLTASLSHTHDGRRFASQFEITRLWSTYSFGSLKMHAEGHFLSEKDINLSAYISSPETKGSFSFVHKLENNNLSTVAKVYANRELISVAINGTLDADERVLSLEGDVTSSFEGLDVKVKVDSKREGNTQNTQVDLTHGTQTATLTHSFTVTDALNWENTFRLNEQYSLRNKMAHVSGEYQHQLEATRGEQRFALDGRLKPVLTADTQRLEGHLELATPWEYLQNKLDFTLEQQTSGKASVLVEVEYKPGRKVTVSSMGSYNHEGTFLSKGSLTTPFWQPLTYDLNLALRPDKKVVLTLTHGESTNVRLAGDYQPGHINLAFNLATACLQYPLGVEGFYDARTPTKSAGVAFIYHHKYEAKTAFSGSLPNGKLELSLREYINESQEWTAVHRLDTRWEHDLTSMPYNIDASLQLEDNVYQAKVTLDETSFTSNMALNGREGSLEAKWLLQPTNSNLSILFQSPVDLVKDFNLAVSFDTQAMESKLQTKYDTQEIVLQAKMEESTFVFQGQTPFSGWETLGASFFVSSTAINAYVSRNDRKIEVTGTQHLRPAKGKVELVVTTPYAGFETVSFDASYNFLGENKTLKFKTVYGAAEIFAKGVVKISDPLAPQVILNISTPFTELRTLRATADWSLNSATRTAAAKVVYNEQEFSWRIEAALEGTRQRVTSKVITPFPGWTQASLEASIAVSEAPYEVKVTVKKEDVTKDFSVRLMLDNNTVHGEVKTPITGWEVVTLDGTYTRGHNTFAGTIRASCGQHTYEASTDLVFDTNNPTLKIEVATPFAQAANLKLEVEGSLAQQQKTLNIVFIKDDVTFSAETTFKLQYKTGFFTLKLRSPVPGFSSLEVEGSYDLLSDVKRSELNVTKEGQRQHFAVSATLNDNHVVLDVATPFPGFQVMKMDADYTSSAPGQHLVVASFLKDSKTYTFRSDVEVRPTSVTVRLATPIAPISRVVFAANYQMLRDAFQGTVRFERNNDVFELSTKCGFTPAACSLSVEAATPVTGWNNLALHLNLKMEPTKLTAEASVQRDAFLKEVSVEAAYSPEQGSLVLRTPVAGWEVLGAEYVLSVTGGNAANAQVKVTRNTQEFVFSAYGSYTQESIAFRFQTPFPGYEESSLQASVNTASRSAKANLQVGPYTFSANGSYTFGDMFLEVATPFPALRFGSVAVKHSVTPGSLEASLKVVHNDNNYFLLGEATVSPRSSVLVLQTKTPITALPNATLKFKYNLDNMNELFTAQLTAGESTYSLVLAAELQEKLANLRVEMNTPFRGWTQVKLRAKVDLTQEDKALELVVEREGSIKAITVYGKLIGSSLNFDLRTPFSGLNRVNVSGSLDRVRRSVEFQMMNDAGEASILASFNSAKFELKTPFARMEEVSFEIKKEGDSYYGTWKRNDNYLSLEMVRDHQNQKVNVEIKSELQGWEFLALAGRLDRRTEQAYASGQINERKVEVTISGVRDDKRRTRNYTLDLKTPYENYQHVTGELRFSSRKRMIKVESNSSPFKIDLKSSRRTGLQAEVFVPNPEQNTELKADFKFEGGSLDFTSRFPILRSLHYDYSVNIDGSEVEMTQKLEVNRMEVFTMEFKANAATQHIHLDIHGRRTGRHLNLHIHREGYNVFNVILKREVTIGGRTTEKQLSLEMNGSGNLPQQGAIHATLTNSFAAVPRTTTIHAEIDRTSTPKTAKLEVTLPGSKLYVFDVRYNIELGNPRQGDFTVRITTPERRRAPWHNFSGSWDVNNPQAAKLEFELGGRKYTAQGKLGLRESDLVATAEGVPDKVFLQWRFIRNGNQRDYFIKVGPESSYRMLKLKGTINGISNGNVEGGIKASFQPHEFTFTVNWERSRPGSFSSQGDFAYGQYTGRHDFQLSRDAATKSASFKFNANSNHPNYRRVILNGNYDFLNKVVFNAEATVNQRVNKINIDISDLNPRRSRNSIEAAFPFLPPQFQVFQMTLQHDFRSNDNKFITAEAKLGQRDSHLRANWKRSDNFDVLEGTLDISSIFIGQVDVGMEYDVSNLNDAHAKVHYRRQVEGQPEKKIDATWIRKKTPQRLETEVTLDSTFRNLQHARAYATADFSQLFSLNAGLDFNEKRITINMDVGDNAVQMEVTTPFRGFESIKGTINYSLGGKNQKVTLHYERGSQQADLEMTLNRKSKRKGDFTLNLTTPFEVLRVLKIEANWNKRQATVEYLRNDVRVSMTGAVQLDSNNSEFTLSFTAPSGRAVTISAAYDVEAFVAGTGTSPTKLAALAIDIEDTKIKFELNGFRSDERLYLEVNGETSFARVRNVHLKLDSELNTQERDGTFEFRFNDFVFEMHNHFERYNDGYYIKSRVESSLTPLPALVFGLGRRGSKRIFTLGYGEEKELTFSIDAKNNFRDGFSGTVDIPNFGYDGVEYDVTYSFPSNDELEIELKAELGGSEHLEAEFEYKSDGVKARLSSPFTGERRARWTRSVTADGFYSEAGFDDYNLKLRGGLKEGDVKRGVVLEADILGREFLLDYQLHSEGPQYTEGKLVLQTPFRGWEKMGGLFTFSSVNLQVLGRAEAFIPFFLNVPRVTAEVNLDLNRKVEGEVTLDVAGEKFSLRTSLTGDSLQEGLSGTVWLVTPFHALSRLQVALNIKVPSSTTLEADLKVTHIYTTYEIDLSYEFSSTQKKMQLRIDDNFLTAECTLGESRFTMNVDTRWAEVRRQLSVDTHYSMLEDLEGSLTAVLGEQTHKMQGVLSIAGSRLRGEVNLESSFIGGVRKLEFNVTVPNTTLDHLSFSVTLTATQVHSFSLDLDTRAGVAVTAEIDTPAFPSTTATLQLTWPRAALTVTTPEATHTAVVSWKQTRKMPADQIVNAELDTPLLGQRYALSMVVGGGRSKAVVKAELQAGDVKHTLEANTFMRPDAGGFAIVIQTPYRNIQKVALSGLLDMSEGVKVETVASLADVSNAFVFLYNANKGTILAEAGSPYIPTGLVKATAEITTEQPNTSLQVAVMNANDVISGRFDLKRPSINDITLRATISTPMEELKTLNGVIKYKRTDVTHMVFSLDHPITFRADVKFSNTDDKFIGNVTAKTSIATLEYVEADIEIPFTEFAPRASVTLPKSKYGFQANYSKEGYSRKAAATLFLDDQTHGGNFSFRSKAPYELAYRYHILDLHSAFHLRTDSSFFTLLM